MSYSSRPVPLSVAEPPKRSASLEDDAVDAVESSELALHDRSIGAIIGEERQLSDAQIERILVHQREKRMRFGEAAVALGFVTSEDVLSALSRQSHYPYGSVAAADKNPELVMARHPFGEQAEAFRELRSQLIMSVLGVNEPRRALAVVSPDSGDGKTFVSANLAVAFSQLGAHTLLIDVDMRSPRQHEVFDVDNSSGLSNILSGRSEANVIRPIEGLPTLFLLPVGNVPLNPLELVQRPAFGMLIHELLTRFDYVIVDTPAAKHGADARVVAATCGAALAVGRKGVSSMRSMEKLVGQLAKSPAKLAGVVMNER